MLDLEFHWFLYDTPKRFCCFANQKFCQIQYANELLCSLPSLKLLETSSQSAKLYHICNTLAESLGRQRNFHSSPVQMCAVLSLLLPCTPCSDRRLCIALLNSQLISWPEAFLKTPHFPCVFLSSFIMWHRSRMALMQLLLGSDDLNQGLKSSQTRKQNFNLSFNFKFHSVSFYLHILVQFRYGNLLSPKFLFHKIETADAMIDKFCLILKVQICAHLGITLFCKSSQNLLK